MRWRLIGVATVMLLGLWANDGLNAQSTSPRPAVQAPPETVRELGALVEQARARFVARDTNGVLGYVAENYRSAGNTKPALREQLLAIYSLYDAVQARVQVDQVHLVDGDAWIYTTGEVNGRLPIVGWVSVLSWQKEPEVARRQGSTWRLIGFQD
ncbi:MAG TPA: hypothetical protein VJU81_02145 [Methylomirabilota bacterium]|nr:hypothetical protein [Methylomirabilota bacterium]